jgi:hypothetical protein
MHTTIPQAAKLGQKLKDVAKRTDAAFLSLESPPAVSPNASPGELLVQMSRPRVDYRAKFREITAKALEPVAEVERAYSECDAYASFLLRCMHVMEGNTDEIGDVLDPDLAAAAKTIRRAKQAGIIEQADIQSMTRKCRDDIRDGIKALEDQSGFTKRYRRAIRKCCMANIERTVDALLSVKGSTLTKLEKGGLRVYRDNLSHRSSLLSELYQKTYYNRKGGYKTSMPVRRFNSLGAL